MVEADPIEPQPTCHACGAQGLIQIGRVADFLPVSSDTRLVSGRLSLALCRSCGILQKVADPEWLAAVQAIYASYDINHQSKGSDPFIFKTIYGPGPRASILATHLGRAVGLALGGSLLDIGCANGNFLARFGENHANWSLFGLETSPHWRQTVLALPGVEGFFNDLAELGDQRFDLIVMSHVLEHIPNPVGYLRRVRKYLTAGGKLFIAVPDIRQNPIDLLVLDHCCHFDGPSLDGLLRQAGFSPEPARSDILGKELISVSRPSPEQSRIPPPAGASFIMSLNQVAENHLSLCSDLIRLAQELRAAHPQFGIMGTSTAAVWVAGELGMEVDFYVEEDPQRIGLTAFGRPILAMPDVPVNACVFVPMAGATAAAIMARSHRPDLILAYLPWDQVDAAQLRVVDDQGPRR